VRPRGEYLPPPPLFDSAQTLSERPCRVNAIARRLIGHSHGSTRVALFTPSHASRLIEDLVDLTRARTGKLRLAVGPVDVRDVIHAAVGICRHAMVRRGQSLAVEAPSPALPVMGDSVRLTQVLNNLLENASRYTPEGGAITLSAAVVDDFCVLTVADSGIGMTEAHGGTVTARSEGQGRGSQFIISLPLLQTPATAPSH
jgi:signal transduction histidine kinase